MIMKDKFKWLRIIGYGLSLVLILSPLFAQEYSNPDVPAPPESKIVDSQNIRLGEVNIPCRLYASSLLPQEIFVYYRTSLAEDGFKLISDKADKDGSRRLGFKRGNAVINIIIALKDGRTEVQTAAYLEPQGGIEKIKPSWAELVSLMPKEEQPGNDLAFIPRPPGGVRIMSMPYENMVLLGYSSPKSTESLKKFYESNMPNQGWQLEREVSMEEAVEEHKQDPDTKELGIDLPFSDITFEGLIAGGHLLWFKGEKGKAQISLFNELPGKRQGNSLVLIKYDKE